MAFQFPLKGNATRLCVLPLFNDDASLPEHFSPVKLAPNHMWPHHKAHYIKLMGSGFVLCSYFDIIALSPPLKHNGRIR
jgi:hypothetical protein